MAPLTPPYVPFGIRRFNSSNSPNSLADFSRFVVTADFSVREISRDKSSVFPRLPSQFTHTGYGCLLDFVTPCPLIRRIRLTIGFLFVRLRFCYPFLSPTPHDVNLGSRFGVRRQLRPLWTFTTDRRHARRTAKKGPRERLAVLLYGMIAVISPWRSEPL